MRSKQFELQTVSYRIEVKEYRQVIQKRSSQAERGIEEDLPNQPRHRIAATLGIGMKPKGRGVAARGARGR